MLFKTGKLTLQQRAKKILLDAMEYEIREYGSCLSDKDYKEHEKTLGPELERQFGRVVKLFKL